MAHRDRDFNRLGTHENEQQENYLQGVFSRPHLLQYCIAPHRLYNQYSYRANLE
jgi:hypothetical protein